MAEYVVGQILLHERDWIKCHYHQVCVLQSYVIEKDLTLKLISSFKGMFNIIYHYSTFLSAFTLL